MVTGKDLVISTFGSPLVIRLPFGRGPIEDDVYRRPGRVGDLGP